MYLHGNIRFKIKSTLIAWVNSFKGIVFEERQTSHECVVGLGSFAGQPNGNSGLQF